MAESEYPDLATPRDLEREREHMPAIPSQMQQQRFAGQTFDFVMTAPVQNKRERDVVRRRLRTLCAESGDRYVYAWTVKDRAKSRETLVEGPTIKLANDLWREYGNCWAGVYRVEDLGTHWNFHAIFVDRETGSIMTRDFIQRKAQKTGMRDADRAHDIVFQIGQSKAIRNVVCNALASETNFMMEEAKKNLLNWVGGNQEKAAKFIEETTEEHGIDMKRIEAVVGRTIKNWTNRDRAKVMLELRSIAEGMITADELYPGVEKKDDKAADTKTDPSLTAMQKKQQGAKASAETKPETKPTQFGPGTDIAVFSFGVRTRNVLEKAGIKIVGDLIAIEEDALLDLEGFGGKCLAEVKHALKSRGLSLAASRESSGEAAATATEKGPADEPAPEDGDAEADDYDRSAPPEDSFPSDEEFEFD